MANLRIKKRTDQIDTFHHEAGKGSIKKPVAEVFNENWDQIDWSTKLTTPSPEPRDKNGKT